MSFSELMPLLPMITLAVASAIMVLLIAFCRSHNVAGFFSALSLILALFFTLNMNALAPQEVTALFYVDKYAVFYVALILVCSLIVIMLSWLYPGLKSAVQPELFVLIMVATLGASGMVCSKHFVSFFLSLETLSVAAYVLIAYLRVGRAYEAGIKYLVLASVSSAFLLLGIGLVYFELGTLDIGHLSELMARHQGMSLFVTAGLAMILVGVGFKLAVVPFHMWAPDIYQGAPAPVTAFIATVSKGAVFAFALRYLSVATNHEYGKLSLVISLIAIASMFGGNLLALLQRNVKRLLAYSSIAHAGYVLVAFQASGEMALQAVAYYLVVYFLSTLTAFGVITVLSNEQYEAENISQFEGLAWKHPLLAAIFTVAIFSLAGIPLTAGFVGKFYVLSAGIRSELWPLVFSLIASTAVGIYYYLRVVVTMYHLPGREAEASESRLCLSPIGCAVLSVLGLAVLYLGIYPARLMEIISQAMSGLI